MASNPIISASVPEDFIQEIDQIARDRGTTRSVVVKQLLEYALDRYHKYRTQYHEVEA
jgi:metal-responsive CopG/Arc/MetJ family transcriptional regulator